MGSEMCIRDSSNGEEELAVVRYNSDGTVDSSFGTDGVTLTDVAGVREDDQGHAIAVQADGKILLGGASDTDNGTFFGGGFEFALLRTKQRRRLLPCGGVGTTSV